jgi:hypothetical protein
MGTVNIGNDLLKVIERVSEINPLRAKCVYGRRADKTA